jgi:D-inositol-3-phosphate glycosyltransferase
MNNIERVAILSVHTCPLATLGGKKTGGMNVYVRELSRELSRRGVAVDVFTRSQDPCVPHVDDNTLGSLARVVHIPAGPESPIGIQQIPEHLPDFAEGILGFAEQEGLRYDLIHSHYWLSGWVAEVLREAWEIPILHMFHTLGHMKNRVAQDPDQKEDPLRVKVETRLVNTVDCIVAATPAERAQLMWLYNTDMSKIKIIPPGVDTQRFHPLPVREARREIGVHESDHMLLFVGRIEPLKGIDTLIRAAAMLYKERTDICLTVIGGDTGNGEMDESEEMTRLKELCEELGVGNLVTFLGAKDQDRLQYYYSAAHVLVMPSDYESFGMVALEAMACGTPVIASEVGGLAFLVQDGLTGFHVPYRDPDDLANKIRLLIDNPPLRAEMSAAAIEHAQTYNWALVTDQVLEAYEGVVASNNS